MSDNAHHKPVLPLLLPMSAILAGATKSGKTTFIQKLLLNADKMFSKPVEEIIVVYMTWQPSYEILEAEFQSKIKFRNDIPSKAELLEITKNDDSQRILLIDDMQSAINNSDLADIVCVLASHRNISVFLLVQNFYYDSKILRTVSLNVQGIFLFKNRRSEQQVKTLATQLSPGNREFILDAYRKACGYSQHGYLYIDLHPLGDPRYQYRTNIFADEDTIIFTPK